MNKLISSKKLKEPNIRECKQMKSYMYIYCIIILLLREHSKAATLFPKKIIFIFLFTFYTSTCTLYAMSVY